MLREYCAAAHGFSVRYWSRHSTGNLAKDIPTLLHYERRQERDRLGPEYRATPRQGGQRRFACEHTPRLRDHVYPISAGRATALGGLVFGKRHHRRGGNPTSAVAAKSRRSL